MKKIVFLLSDITISGGIQRVLSRIANGLVLTKKYDITLLSLFKTNSSPFFHLDERVKTSNLFSKKINLHKHYFRAIKKLNDFVKNNDIDIFITAGIGYIPISFWSTRRIKTVACEHSNVLIGKKFGLAWWGRAIATRMSDCLVVLSKKDLMNYRAAYKNIKRIEQIYNPIDNFIVKPEYDLKSKKIMSCGSLVYQKGFDILIEVAKLVFERHPDWSWDIYGDGEMREELEQRIIKNDLTNHLTIRGYVNNIDDCYRKHSMFVLTSRYEGFVMVLLEALKNNLPIVSFNCPCGPSEMVINDVNGYLIDCFDITCMADKICYLIENINIRANFSKKSDELLHLFDEKIILNKWERLIDSL